MKRKILVLFMLLCIIISSTGCFNKKSQTNVSVYNANNSKGSQYAMSKDKTDLTEVQMCDKDNKNVYLYNVDKKIKSVVSSVVSPKKYINTVSVNDEWIVWVEDDVKVETDTLYDINWRAYARNLKTGEIIQVDKDKGIKVDPSAVYVEVEPYEFSLFGDKVVYVPIFAIVEVVYIATVTNNIYALSSSRVTTPTRFSLYCIDNL